MRLFTSLVASLAVFAFAATATADITIAVSSTDDLTALTAGDTFTLDVTLTTTTPEAVGVGLRVANWNAGDLTFVSGTTPGVGGITANGMIFGLEIAPGFFASGLAGTFPAPFYEATGSGANPALRPGESVNLFQGVATAAPATAGPETFTVTFQYNGGAGTIDAGIFSAYGDGYTSTAGNGVSNGSIDYGVIPEPGTALLMGLGLVGLASAGRRE